MQTYYVYPILGGGSSKATIYRNGSETISTSDYGGIPIAQPGDRIVIELPFVYPAAEVGSVMVPLSPSITGVTIRFGNAGGGISGCPAGLISASSCTNITCTFECAKLVLGLGGIYTVEVYDGYGYFVNGMSINIAVGHMCTLLVRYCHCTDMQHHGSGHSLQKAVSVNGMLQMSLS